MKHQEISNRELDFILMIDLFFKNKLLNQHMTKFILCCLIILLSSTIVCTQTHINIGKKPSWVNDISFENSKKDIESPYNYFLVDWQKNAILKENYFHYVVRLNNIEGVQEMSSLSIDFDPLYQYVTVHDILIYRDGKVQKRLNNDFRVIQQEKDLQRALYNGKLTALKELEDVREGDILEYAYTIHGYNPVYKQHRFTQFYQDFSLEIDRLYQSILIDKKLNERYSEGAVEPEITNQNGVWNYVWDLKNRNAVYEDYTVPHWIPQYNYASLSSMDNWGEVTEWASQLYKISDSERKALKSIVAKDLKLNGSNEDILNAIRFVQDKIRYLGFEEGISAFKPHHPIDVYNQRFGDCKDKSFLLSTILQEMGVDAAPMLVNSNYGKLLDKKLPSPNQFDHCIVTFKRNGIDYIVDPTQSNQGGNLSKLSVPNYHFGLPIRKGNQDLLSFKDQEIPMTIVDETIDLDSIGGLAQYRIFTRYKGKSADYQRTYFNSNNRSDIKKAYQDFVRNVYPDAKLDSISLIDESRVDENEILVKEYYTIPNAWVEKDGQLIFEAYAMVLNGFVNIGQHTKDSLPYYLGPKKEFIQTTTINLPESWQIPDGDKVLKNEYFDYNYTDSYANKVLTLKYRYYLKNEVVNPKDVNKVSSELTEISQDLSYLLSYNTAFLNAENLDNFAWQSFIILIAGLIFGFFICRWLLFTYDPEPLRPHMNRPIDGWLILIGIGLVLTPGLMLFQFIGLWNEGIYQSATWLTISTSDDFTFRLVGKFIMIFEGLGNVILFLFSISTIYLFIKRRSSIPKVMVVYYSVFFLFLLFDAVLVNIISPEEQILNEEFYKSIIKCVIWVPYFMYSERVKDTFTVQLNPIQKSTIEDQREEE